MFVIMCKPVWQFMSLFDVVLFSTSPVQMCPVYFYCIFHVLELESAVLATAIHYNVLKACDTVNRAAVYTLLLLTVLVFTVRVD